LAAASAPPLSAAAAAAKAAWWAAAAAAAEGVKEMEPEEDFTFTPDGDDDDATPSPGATSAAPMLADDDASSSDRFDDDGGPHGVFGTAAALHPPRSGAVFPRPATRERREEEEDGVKGTAASDGATRTAEYPRVLPRVDEVRTAGGYLLLQGTDIAALEAMALVRDLSL
jgi:hypothetical protein